MRVVSCCWISVSLYREIKHRNTRDTVTPPSTRLPRDSSDLRPDLRRPNRDVRNCIHSHSSSHRYAIYYRTLLTVIPFWDEWSFARARKNGDRSTRMDENSDAMRDVTRDNNGSSRSWHRIVPFRGKYFTTLWWIPVDFPAKRCTRESASREAGATRSSSSSEHYDKCSSFSETSQRTFEISWIIRFIRWISVIFQRDTSAPNERATILR